MLLQLTPRPHNRPKSNLLAIAGNIGVGKTSLSKLLHSRFGWQVYYEPEVTNPYLESFYRDMRRWAFHSQIFFLTQRFNDHLSIQKLHVPCIQDRTIFEDAEIFAENLFQGELLPARDYESYRNLYQAMIRTLEEPALVVYLKASTWTLLSRIRKRGRDYERDIDKEYLAQLNIGYDRWIKKISESWNVLVIDTDNYDMHKDVSWLEGILEEIGDRIMQIRSPNLVEK
jgi:deoxyadenosine/deoxycytidine kinase